MILHVTRMGEEMNSEDLSEREMANVFSNSIYINIQSFIVATPKGNTH